MVSPRGTPTGSPRGTTAVSPQDETIILWIENNYSRNRAKNQVISSCLPITS